MNRLMDLPRDPGGGSPLTQTDRPTAVVADPHAGTRQAAWNESLARFVSDQNSRYSLLASTRQDFRHEASTAGLRGQVVGVKDIIRVQGFDTTAGSLLPQHLWAGPEAAIVRRIRSRGGILLAKTATTEFAYLEPAPTYNPWHAGYTPGGSSSGSAAGVAAGCFDIGIGTQTVGSVIRPASFCGVCGFKPSLGLVNRDGVIIFSETVDQLGFFSRDWVSMELFSASALDLPVGDTGDLENIRFGLMGGSYLAQADSAMRTHIGNLCASLEQAGWEVQELSPPVDNISALNDRHLDLTAHDFYRMHARWFAEYSYLYRQRTAELVVKGSQISSERYEECKASCGAWRAAVENLMRQECVDVLVSPSAVGTAIPGRETTGDPIMNLPWTHAGLPVTSVPLGLAQNDRGHWLPVGLQLTARFHQDRMLLRISEEIARRLELRPAAPFK